MRHSPFPAHRAPVEPAFAPAQVARLAGTDSHGSPLIQLTPGAVPLRARVALSGPLALDAAVTARAQVVVIFEEGDLTRPIVVACLEPAVSQSGAHPPVCLHAVPPAPPEDAPAAREAAPLTMDAEIDGRRVQLMAQDELVLRCGEASITLRRNGKVIVRGAHVETHASGTNRIKGGQVRIN